MEIQGQEIQRQETDTSGRYVINLPDGAEAYLTFVKQKPAVMVIDHTFVPPQYRSQGIAVKLSNQAFEDAKQNNMKIVPQCPYIAARIRRQPELADLAQ